MASAAVTILGRGRVGRSLAAALDAAGIAVELRPARAPEALADGFAAQQLVVLAVPDRAIGSLAARVRGAHRGHGTTRGADGRPAVIHLSGASGPEPLQSLAEAGWPVGIAHPMAAFPDVRPPAFLRGVTFGVTASTPELRTRIDELVSAIGGIPRAVADDGWVAYHAAAVVASNYLVVLAAQAAQLLQRAGFQRVAAGDALLPLMRGTLDNLAAEGVDGALSGPLRRGDVGTVERHLAWLDDAAPELAATYRALARPGIDLAVGTGLDAAAARALRRAVE